MDYLFHIVPAVAVGLQITLKIFIITIVLSLPLGILMAIGRISKIAILRKAMYAYIYVMRGTPLMLQILFIYYGLPFIIDGLKLPAFPAAIIAFVVGSAALAESGLRIIGAHTDSPGLRIKPRPAEEVGGMVRLGVEVYGGPILATFADRDLSLAGRVTYRRDGKVESQLIDFKLDRKSVV